MKFILSDIEGLVEIRPSIFQDDRGYFFESYNKKTFAENGINEDFVQDNQSFSVKGVLRGLHFQTDPYAQGKLVRVIEGVVMDVAVDIRPDSPTFGQHRKFLLTSDEQNMLYIPPGFAHGFVSLENAIFSYKCTKLYNKESESGIRYDDPFLGIDWGIISPIVSEKDQSLRSFQDYELTIRG